MNILPPQSIAAIVDKNGQMEQRFRSWTQEVSRLAIIEGAGSPEGVVQALPTSLYMDNAGASGSVLYIKQKADIAGDRSQGWILV